MTQPSTPTVRWNGHRVRAIAVSAALHLLVPTVFTAIFCSVFLNEQAMQVLPNAWAVGELRDEMLTSMVVVFGLSACLWALVVLCGVMLKQRAREKKLRALRAGKGTIITETLIVLPIFILLTFGLAQMGINSMAGLLGTVAVYEAGRTVAVWGPEVGHNRSGNGSVSRSVVEDRARIVAAGILTPVVPSLVSGLCQGSQAFNDMQAGMLGALGPPTDPMPRTRIWSFVDALDTQTFAGRGVAKHRLAYCATTVTYQNSIITDPDSNDRATFRTTLDYAHPIAMPMVGRVFNHDPGAGPWATPYVTVIHREYTLTQQLSPNPEVPQSNAFRKLISNLPSPF